jgi:DNA-binding Lrp family transcriptional regulator
MLEPDEITNPLKAMVFLRVDSRIEKMVIDEIRTIEGVSEAHYIYGPYDMYVVVNANSLKMLQDIILGRIRDMYGVISTTTCYVAR